MRTILASLFLLATAVAQTTVGSITTLGAGERLYDTSGRHVENNGTNSNGSLNVKYDGRIKKDVQGRAYVEGNITEVTNPSSQGADGPIVIETAGQSLTINLNRNGAIGALRCTIGGGNATVNVNGDNNDVTIGGTGNNVTINGRNSTGTGTAGSGGDVRVNSTTGSFQSGGGNWTFRR